MHVKCLADTLAHLVNVSCYTNEEIRQTMNGNSLAFLHPGGYVNLPSSREPLLSFFPLPLTSPPMPNQEGF